MKRVAPEHGLIIVFRCERGKPYPSEKATGFKNISCWSRGASPWSQLSPFHLGPVEQSLNFENFWHAQKVYERVAEQKQEHWKWPAEDHGSPNEAWHAWRRALYANPFPVRRPNGRTVPLYAFWEGERLGIVEARKRIYIPYLQALYRAHPTYTALLNLVRGGQNVCLIEPDGPLFNMTTPLTIPVLRDLQAAETVGDAAKICSAVENIDRKRYAPYGHGFVIALTLLEDLAE